MTSGLLRFFLLSVLVVITISFREVSSVPFDDDADDDAALQGSQNLIQTEVAHNNLGLPEFEKFKSDHRKVYESEEEENYRYQIFVEALERTSENNNKRQGRGAERTQGITKFSDKTFEEFKRYLGFVPSQRLSESNITLPAVECPACENFADTVNQAKETDEINWVALGAVTEVKDQGVCGSCWAFSTIVDVEGAYYLKYKELRSWSEEQLVQCDRVDAGCDGGLMETAMKYIMGVDGVDSELAYPYLDCTYTRGQTHCLDYKPKCKSFTSGIGLGALARLSDYYFISYNKPSAEPEIKTALFTSGPLSCAIDAYPMLDYISGVDDPEDCGNTFEDLNHGVAFVGYGTSDSGINFWVIKNSWGSDWGADGYYMIVYGSNACGLALYVVHSVIH